MIILRTLHFLAPTNANANACIILSFTTAVISPMESLGPPLAPPQAAASALDIPNTPGGQSNTATVARRNSQKRQSLTGLKFLNELLDDQDQDLDQGSMQKVKPMHYRKRGTDGNCIAWKTRF